VIESVLHTEIVVGPMVAQFEGNGRVILITLALESEAELGDVVNAIRQDSEIAGLGLTLTQITTFQALPSRDRLHEQISSGGSLYEMDEAIACYILDPASLPMIVPIPPEEPRPETQISLPQPTSWTEIEETPLSWAPWTPLPQDEN
jgi:hypothetical protein